MAPNRPQVVSFKALTVRSGSALPSLHQKSQPMSQGTYSASRFRRSNTMRAASMTSLPTPSPGIHAILYLAIRSRLYRRAFRLASGGSGSPKVPVRLGPMLELKLAKLLNCEPRRIRSLYFSIALGEVDPPLLRLSPQLQALFCDFARRRA